MLNLESPSTFVK